MSDRGARRSAPLLAAGDRLVLQRTAMGRLVKGTGRVVAAQVLTARDEALAIVERARQEALQLRVEAEREAEELRRQARQQGRTEAEVAASALMLAARADAEMIRQRARELAMPLAARMAARIAGRAIELDPTVITDIVEQALRELRARDGRVAVRVHPEELARLEKEHPRLLAQLGPAAELIFVPAPDVGRRGCVVETPTGHVDARLDAQLAALERALSEQE